MKKPLLFLSFILLGVLFTVGASAVAKEDTAWRIGGKIHFEDKSGPGYIGLEEIGGNTQAILRETLDIKGSCPLNAKVLLKRERGSAEMTYYEEKSRPGTGEEMHATLLYTQPRGFCDSETLKQVCPVLFDQCKIPPTIEEVAKTYSAIIRPDSKFQILEIILTKLPSGPSFLMAKLLFEGHENIYTEGKPVSAGLHLTLANCADGSILGDDEMNAQLVEKLNKAFKGRVIKISERHGVADLEFGMPGSSWRLRAGKQVERQ